MKKKLFILFVFILGIAPLAAQSGNIITRTIQMEFKKNRYGDIGDHTVMFYSSYECIEHTFLIESDGWGEVEIVYEAWKDGVVIPGFAYNIMDLDDKIIITLYGMQCMEYGPGQYGLSVVGDIPNYINGISWEAFTGDGQDDGSEFLYLE